MQVILKEDIEFVGHRNDVVSVKNGYGRNYLIPKGMAVLATKTAMKVHEENMRQRAHKEAKIREELEKMVAKLKGASIKVVAKVGDSGKIFGSVGNVQVAEAIAKMGFDIERKNISIKGDAIKSTGKYQATVKLYKDLVETVEFEVVGE